MDISAEVKRKYPALDEADIELFINRARSIYVERLYPADYSIDYKNYEWDNDGRAEMWLLDCVDELVGRVGIESVLSYKENGMSWTFDRAGVSQALLDRVPRMARAIGKDPKESDK